MDDIIYREESYKIIGACMTLYKEKGCGFLEPVYQECLAIEFETMQIPFVGQPHLNLEYRGHQLRQTYQPDFICYNKIIVELKAVSKLVDEHRAQILNYLNACKFELGLLVNFGHHPKLEWERIANSKNVSLLHYLTNKRSV